MANKEVSVKTSCCETDVSNFRSKLVVNNGKSENNESDKSLKPDSSKSDNLQKSDIDKSDSPLKRKSMIKAIQLMIVFYLLSYLFVLFPNLFQILVIEMTNQNGIKR